MYKYIYIRLLYKYNVVICVYYVYNIYIYIYIHMITYVYLKMNPSVGPLLKNSWKWLTFLTPWSTCLEAAQDRSHILQAHRAIELRLWQVGPHAEQRPCQATDGFQHQMHPLVVHNCHDLGGKWWKMMSRYCWNGALEWFRWGNCM